MSHKQRQDEKCSAFILEKSKKFKIGVCKRTENSDDILRPSQALEQNETVPFYVCYKPCHNIRKAMTHILGSRAMTPWH